MAFLFISRSAPLLSALPFPCLRGSYRLRPRRRRGAGRCVGRIVGGRRHCLASRSSVPFYLSVPSLRSVRFPRIGLKPDNVRRFCQLVSLTHCVRLRSSPFVLARLRSSSVGGGSVSFSLTRYARPFVSSLFSSPRLVGRLVVILCGSLVGSSRLAHQFARRPVALSRPAVQFPVLFIVLRCFALPGSSFPVSFLVSSARLVKQSVFSRFARRLVLAARGVG